MALIRYCWLHQIFSCTTRKPGTQLLRPSSTKPQRYVLQQQPHNRAHVNQKNHRHQQWWRIKIPKETTKVQQICNVCSNPNYHGVREVWYRNKGWHLVFGKYLICRAFEEPHVYHTPLLTKLTSLSPQRDDFQVFQFERILNVQCLQRVVAGDNTPLDPELVCFRGLEPYRSEKRREKFLRGRQIHVEAILEEQDRQRAEGEDDPEALREIVAFSSRHTLKIAQYQALVDQHEAGLKKIVQNKAKTSTNTQLEDIPVPTPTLQAIAVRAA